MSEEPTNGELAVMIEGITKILELRFDQNEKDHNSVNAHLKKLNGQVVKNTHFRTRWSGAYLTIGITGAIAGLWATIRNLFV